MQAQGANLLVSARRGIKQKQAQNLSTLEKNEIFQLWMNELSDAEICRRKNVSRHTLHRIAKAEEWEARKVFVQQATLPEDAAVLIEAKKKAKTMLLSVLSDLFDVWNTHKKTMIPRSLSDIPNAMAKLVDSISKINDDGDPEALKSIVEIIVTDGRQKMPVMQLPDEQDVLESETVPQLEAAPAEVDEQDIPEPETG